MRNNTQPIPWAQVIHIYQPPGWSPSTIRRVLREAYEPMIATLEQLPETHITLNIAGSLTEQLIEIGAEKLLERIGTLATNGQIELLGTAAYHPILPLLPDAEIRRQIELNHEIHKRVFGDAWNPRGFFPPELAVSEQLLQILNDMGFEYVIASDLAYDGTISDPPATTHYRSLQSDMCVVFRSREHSDTFLDACVRSEHTFHNEIGRGRTQPLVTAIDGENLGHHRTEMRKIWKSILESNHFATLTVSELRRQARGIKSFALHTSSWSSREDELAANIPFGLWHHPNNPIHALLWQLTHLALDVVPRSTTEARALLDRALNSDHFWWASASPWWSVELVNQGARRLLRTIEQSQNTAALAKAKQIVNNISRRSHEWQASGTAEQRKRESIEYFKHVNFFGGDQIS